MNESRLGKYVVVALSLVLAAVLATSRPKKPRVVYPMAAALAAVGVWVAWRVKVGPPMQRVFPLGDPMTFIADVPTHRADLAAWARTNGVSSPPPSRAGMDEWIWDSREALGARWEELMRGLVAAYGEALRAEAPTLVWIVRRGEPTVGSPRSRWFARDLFREVHDAVFADL